MDLEVKRRMAQLLITKLSSVSDQARTSALCELRLLTKSDPLIRPIITSIDDGAAVSYLSELLYSTSPITRENAAASLLNLSISCKESLMSTRGLLDSLSHVLSNHKAAWAHPAAVQSAAATIYSLSLDERYRGVIGSKRDILYSIVDIVSAAGSSTRKDAVKAMFGLAMYEMNRRTMLEFGAARVLFELVVSDGRVGAVEDATAVIAQLAGCEEGPEEFRKARRGGGVRVLVDLIDSGGSVRVMENAVSGLLKLVEFGGEAVAEEIREVGLGLVFDGLGEVADCGSEKGKRRARDLIRVLEGGMSRKDEGGDSRSSVFSSGPMFSY